MPVPDDIPFHHLPIALETGAGSADQGAVTHADIAEDLVRKGRDIESHVLGRAVAWHVEHRVLANGSKTVVFGD